MKNVCPPTVCEKCLSPTPVYIKMFVPRGTNKLFVPRGTNKRGHRTDGHLTKRFIYIDGPPYLPTYHKSFVQTFFWEKVWLEARGQYVRNLLDPIFFPKAVSIFFSIIFSLEILMWPADLQIKGKINFSIAL